MQTELKSKLMRLSAALTFAAPLSLWMGGVDMAWGILRSVWFLSAIGAACTIGGLLAFNTKTKLERTIGKGQAMDEIERLNRSSWRLGLQ